MMFPLKSYEICRSPFPVRRDHLVQASVSQKSAAWPAVFFQSFHGSDRTFLLQRQIWDGKSVCLRMRRLDQMDDDLDLDPVTQSHGSHGSWWSRRSSHSVESGIEVTVMSDGL